MLENVRSVGKESYQNKILAKAESGKVKASQNRMSKPPARKRSLQKQQEGKRL